MRVISNKQQGFSPALAIILIATVLVVGFVGWRVYDANKTQTNAPATQTNNSTPSGAGSQVNTPTESLIAFTDLGLQIKVPSDFAGQLVYAQSTSGTYPSVRLAAKDVTAIDAACGLDGGGAALGVIFKVSGAYPAEPNAMNTPGKLVKQFADSYVAYRSPQQDCTQNEQAKVLLAAHLMTLETALDSITEIE